MKFKINNIIPIHQLPNDHNNPLENQLRNVTDISSFKVNERLIKWQYIHFTEKKTCQSFEIYVKFQNDFQN